MLLLQADPGHLGFPVLGRILAVRGWTAGSDGAFNETGRVCGRVGGETSPNTL